MPILVSADGAGATRAWLAHLRAQRQSGVDLEFSVGFTMTAGVQTAILALPRTAWTEAINADGSPRDGADVAELTGMLGDLTAAGWPSGMRVIVRRERPHPGAQLSFTVVDGWRLQAFATDTRVGQLAQLEARHRKHARVEDRIRCAKNTGLDHMPSRQFAINAAWVELTLTAADLMPGPRPLCSTTTSPPPNRRPFATDSYTSPPASPADNDDCSSGSTPPGPGGASSPSRSPASTLCPSRSPEPRHA